MITKAQRRNAERIVDLADNFGRLHFNRHQTVEMLLNLSIPCAQLIKAGVVTGVVDSFDAVNDQAVTDMERYCREAVQFETEMHGRDWWNERAAELL